MRIYAVELFEMEFTKSIYGSNNKNSLRRQYDDSQYHDEVSKKLGRGVSGFGIMIYRTPRRYEKRDIGSTGRKTRAIKTGLRGYTYQISRVTRQGRKVLNHGP